VTYRSFINRLTLAALTCLIGSGAATAHEGAQVRTQSVAAAPAPTRSQVGAPTSGPRWLAGDHHIHSRFSPGWDTKTTPPTPIIGGDAIYPIPMNATMARRYGLSWMVATDHGGPNHSKIAHDHSYPELLQSRLAVPEVIQFFGMELNSPAADHSSVVIPQGADEAERLLQIESMFDANEAFPKDEARNQEPRMVAALKFMDGQTPKPVVFANHPSRSATGIGVYGLDTPAEFRNWNDAAPDVSIGMEGAPGHQASGQSRERFATGAASRYFGKARPRGGYGRAPTMGGYDQMTARIGGLWDSMLGEGRRWWVTATSDSHVHWTDGGSDFWPGEFSKTYVFAEKTHDAILGGLRSGRVFVTTGDLISELDVTVKAVGGSTTATMGGNLVTRRGTDIEITIRFRDDTTPNANGDNPVVSRVDLIRGDVTGPVSDRTSDTNPTTRVEARFTAAQWTRAGDYRTIKYIVRNVSKKEYIRVRGTNTAELEPLPDPDREIPWADLWFYSNPVFITPS
jgi:hypothetical protein